VVLSDKNYIKQFKRVFGVNQSHINSQHILKAIVSYERTLVSGDSSFDQYYFGRDKSQLSPSAARGLRLFRRKGNCANCHEISWDNALFMDNQFYNIGVESQALAPIIETFVKALKHGSIEESIALTDTQKSALGRFQVTGVISDVGKFKTPTLRDIALTAPYMHDGSVKTLADVVEYYDQGGHANPFLDAAIFPLHLTDQEKKDLVAFMQALTVHHSDEGWGYYADGFDVLGAKGERLTRRILRHPHVDEQPFTRIRGGVRLPETVGAVTVRARCSVDGFVGKKVGVVLPTH